MIRSTVRMALVAGVLLASLVTLAAPAIAVVRTQSRTYQVQASDRNGWSASARGDIVFSSTRRTWKVFGAVTVYDGTANDAAVMLEVRQNINDTTADGPWFAMCYSTWGMAADRNCNVNRDLDPVSFGTPSRFQVGYRGEGEFFSFTTQTGRGLRGLWVRVCHGVSGPDVCGSPVYVDNPYHSGTRP